MKYLAALLLLFASSASALTVDQPLDNAGQEARARQLFTELRCMVCQGEAIADSPVDVARDMRAAVRELVASGKSNEEIKNFFAEQYGEKILMMPRFSSSNLLLWGAPFLVLIAGFALIWYKLFKGSSHD